MALKRGDKAPEILGVDQAGKEIRLSDFAGSKLILYFYPKDNTPGGVQPKHAACGIITPNYKHRAMP